METFTKTFKKNGLPLNELNIYKSLDGTPAKNKI